MNILVTGPKQMLTNMVNRLLYHGYNKKFNNVCDEENPSLVISFSYTRKEIYLLNPTEKKDLFYDIKFSICNGFTANVPKDWNAILNTLGIIEPKYVKVQKHAFHKLNMQGDKKEHIAIVDKLTNKDLLNNYLGDACCVFTPEDYNLTTILRWEDYKFLNQKEIKRYENSRKSAI